MLVTQCECGTLQSGTPCVFKYLFNQAFYTLEQRQATLINLEG